MTLKNSADGQTDRGGSTIGERDFAGFYLCPDRSGLHDGVRRTSIHQFCARGHLHARSVCRVPAGAIFCAHIQVWRNRYIHGPKCLVYSLGRGPNHAAIDGDLRGHRCVIEQIADRPLRDRPRLNVLITAIGVSLFIQNLTQYRLGAEPRAFPQLIPVHVIEGLGNLTILTTQVAIIAATIVLLIILHFIVMKTKIGLAMRALSLNPTACSIMGVNNDVVISFTFALGSALAAAAGILVSMDSPSIYPLMGNLPGIKAFVAAVLGGIGNIPGAALGGLIIGILETLVVAVGFPQWRDAIAFAILIIILLFKPNGILGRVEQEKV